MDPITNGVLVQIDEAKAFLDNFTGTAPEVQEYVERASAWVEFFKRCQTGLHAQNVAAELKIRLQRKLGEVLPPPRPARRPRKNETPDGPELREIDSREAAKYRKIAAIPVVEFENYIRDTKTSGLELTTAGVLRRYAAMNRKPRDGERVPAEVDAPPRTDEAPELSPADAILADMTRLTRKLTVFINSPDGSKLKDYLHACRLGGWLANRTIKVRLDDGTYKDLPIRFRGFNALRWFVRLAAKKGTLTPAKVAQQFNEAQGTEVGEWEGDTPTGGQE